MSSQLQYVVNVDLGVAHESDADWCSWLANRACGLKLFFDDGSVLIKPFEIVVV